MTTLSDIQAVHLGEDKVIFVQTKDGQLFAPNDTESVSVELDEGHKLMISSRDGKVVRVTSDKRTPSPLQVKRVLTVVGETKTARPVDDTVTIESTHSVFVGDQLHVRAGTGFTWRLWGTVKHLSTHV